MTMWHIIDPKEYPSFIKAFELKSGNKLPIEYLESEKSNVYGIYRKGVLAGGYILNHGPDLRYRQMLTANGIDWPDEIIPEDSIEITCMWAEPRLKVYESLFLHMKISAYVKKHPERFFISGTRIKKLADAHRAVIPNTFFTGYLPNAEGQGVFWEIMWGTKHDLDYRLMCKEACRRITKKVKSQLGF